MLSVTQLEKAMEGTLAQDRKADPPGSAAAVSAIFRDGNAGLEVLFIRRAERAGDPWSGHMAFPGGRRDPRDPDLLSTSVRETREEIGLDLGTEGALLGVLEDQSAVTRNKELGMWIRPYVFRLRSRMPELSLNHEVTEAIWAPIGPIISGERASSIEVTHESVNYTMPAYDVDGRIVWGLTYWMLERILGRLRAVPPET